MGGEDCGRPAPRGGDCGGRVPVVAPTVSADRFRAAGPGENRYCSVRSRLWQRVTPRSSTAGLRAAATVDPGGRVLVAVAVHERLHDINEGAVSTMPESEPTPSAPANVISSGERGQLRQTWSAQANLVRRTCQTARLTCTTHQVRQVGQDGCARPGRLSRVWSGRQVVKDEWARRGRLSRMWSGRRVRA